MKFIVATVFGAVFLTLCEAIPTPESKYSLHEKRIVHSKIWARGSRINGDDIVPVRIGLTQTNLDDSYAHLMDV